MTEKEIVQRHAYYFDVLEEMGQMGVSHKPTMGNLEIPRGIVQRAYKEMNEERNQFMGSIIEYLEWVSANFFLWIVEKQTRFRGPAVGEKIMVVPYSKIKDNPPEQATQIPHSFRVEFAVKREIPAFYHDFVNMVRLYRKNKQYITDLLRDVHPDITEGICRGIESSMNITADENKEGIDAPFGSKPPSKNDVN